MWLYKIIYIYIYFSWKAHGEISSIESHLSDTRLFGLLKLITTIPLPQSTQIDEKQQQSKVYFSLNKIFDI